MMARTGMAILIHDSGLASNFINFVRAKGLWYSFAVTRD